MLKAVLKKWIQFYTIGAKQMNPPAIASGGASVALWAWMTLID
jgi:hypothetical protein